MHEVQSHDEQIRPRSSRLVLPSPVPRYALADKELDPDVVYRILHDELLFNGSARLNLATFVSTWMEPQAEKLMAECFAKNMIDKDEYP